LAVILSLSEAIREFVHDGDVVALEGFTHLIPFAAGHEVIRQKRRNLTLIRMTPDVIYDQMIGAGCAAKLKFSWAATPAWDRCTPAGRRREGLACAARHREHEHAGMAPPMQPVLAPALRRVRGYVGTELPEHTTVKFIDCPFTAKARRRARPSSRCRGDPCAESGPQRQCPDVGCGRCAERSRARLQTLDRTVEEIVDDLQAPPIPWCFLRGSWARCARSRRAFPSYAQVIIHAITRSINSGTPSQGSRHVYRMDRAHVMGTKNMEEFRKSIEGAHA